MDRFVGAGDPIFGDGSRSRPRTESRRSRSETDEALALLDSLLELWGDGPGSPSSRERDHLLIFGEPERPYSLADELDAEFDDEQFLESMLRPPGPPEPEYYEKLEAGRLSMKLWLDFKPPGRAEAIQTLPYRDFRVAEALLEDSEQYVTKYPQPRHSRGTAHLVEQIAKLLEPEHLAKAWAIQAHARPGGAVGRASRAHRGHLGKAGAGNWPLDALRRFGEEVLDEARDPAAGAREAATLLFLRGRTFPD